MRVPVDCRGPLSETPAHVHVDAAGRAHPDGVDIYRDDGGRVCMHLIDGHRSVVAEWSPDEAERIARAILDQVEAIRVMA